MNISDLRQNGYILFETISGSRAYGTNRPESDTDYRGLFLYDRDTYLGLSDYQETVSDDKQDITFYELRRFFNLAADCNPNIVELLYTSPKNWVSFTPAWNEVVANRHLFLSRKAFHTFSGYAFAQIKKSTGQNKLVHNPKPKNPPSKWDFCYYTEDNVFPPCRPRKVENPDDFNLNHVVSGLEHTGVYRLYRIAGRGIFRNGNLACESISIEDEAKFCGIFIFNEQEYEKAHRDWKNYWDWIANRNPDRWRDQESGKTNYDQKNLMHCFRLLHSGRSILEGNGVVVEVQEPCLSFLHKIRNGEYQYEHLMEIVEEEMENLKKLAENCSLPYKVDANAIEQLYRHVCSIEWTSRS